MDERTVDLIRKLQRDVGRRVFVIWLLTLSSIASAVSLWRMENRQRAVEQKVEQLQPLVASPPLPINNLHVYQGMAVSASWGNGIAKALEDHEARLKKLEGVHNEQSPDADRDAGAGELRRTR